MLRGGARGRDPAAEHAEREQRITRGTRDQGGTETIDFDKMELTNARLLSSDRRSYATGSGYSILLMSVTYKPSLLGPSCDTTMRMVIPDTFHLRLGRPTGLGHLGLVAMVTGSKGVGVGAEFGDAEDDAALDLLASGEPDLKFGRTDAPPMAAFSFNNPGYGSSTSTPPTLADPAPEFVDFSPNNSVGDDYSGPQSAAAIEAVVDTAYEVLDFFLRPAEVGQVRLIVSSFSNGITGAAAWMKRSSRDVHAWVEDEGPVDSAEQTLATEAYNPFPGVLGPLPGKLTYEAWYSCTPSARDANFNSTFQYYWRPPDEVAQTMWQVLHAHGQGALTWPVDLSQPEFADAIAAGTIVDPATLLDDTPEFWDERRSLDLLAYRKGAYIRVQARKDHVQPHSYQNRHAIRAMARALKSGCNVWDTRKDVYFADEAYLTDAQSPTDAVRDSAAPLLVSGGWNENDPDTFPDWPKGGVRTKIRVDLAQWALMTTFDSSTGR